MSKTPKMPAFAKKTQGDILKAPKQKHPGALGDTMRKHHNTRRMAVVRAHRSK